MENTIWTKRFRILCLCLVAAFIASLFLIIPMDKGQAANSFPYNANYSYGISAAYTDQATYLRSEYNDWKSHYVTSSGCPTGALRVQRDEATYFDTVSEGMGYGMLLAVYFDDQIVFDALWKYVKKYQATNGKGLMSWRINANGSPVETNCATDADFDMAAALCFAYKKWGSSSSFNYSTEADNLIKALKYYTIEPGTYVVKPGENWGGSGVMNPSYFAPAWFKVYGQKTNDTAFWDNVIRVGYENLANIDKYNGTAGLVPDWCRQDGTPSGMSYIYAYDAVRTPWRLAVDYSWFGDQRAKKYVDPIRSFFTGKAATVVAKYKITGEQIFAVDSAHNPTAISMNAPAMLTGTSLTEVQSWYNELKKVKEPYYGQPNFNGYHYFGNTLRLLSLLHLTGNFPNLYGASESTNTVPQPTPTVIPTVTPTKTPVQITPTPISSPVLSPITGSEDLEVEFYNGSLYSESGSINTNYKITNRGTSSVDLSDIKVRYYYTVDGEREQRFGVDYASVGSSNVVGNFVKMSSPTSDADYYLEMGFKSGCGYLSPGASIYVQGRIYKSDWSSYRQTNDYSFNSSASSYTKWKRTSGYRRGSLVWGDPAEGSSSNTVPTPTPTKTPVAPTPTKTATPTPIVATPSPVAATPTSTPTQISTSSGGLKVQMYNASLSGSTSGINPKIRIVNTGTTSINLSDVKVRYYYTVNGYKSQSFFCDWTSVGNSNVTGSLVKMISPATGADYYLEIGFTSGAGSLAAGASVEVHGRFAKSDWSSYTQSDDYSFNSSAASYVDWNKVSGWISGSLKWGTQP